MDQIVSLLQFVDIEIIKALVSLLQILPDGLVTMFIGYPLLAVWSLWIFYLAIMNLKKAKEAGTMTPVAKFCGYSIVIPGYILDILVNIFIGSILFLEFPNYKRLTLSARMDYLYVPGSISWRSRLADWLARNLLNTYDPSGEHIDSKS